MVAPERLALLHTLVQQADRERIPGDLVECGSWNGGSAAIMAAAGALGADESARRVWVCDSFEGLPAPSTKDGALERDMFFTGWCTGDPRNVEGIFHRLAIPRQRLRIVKGRFDQTLPRAAIASIAILHIDADWYASVTCVLETLYDRVASGGFVIFDDYGKWAGCRRAAQDFIAKRRLGGLQRHQVGIGMYIRKALGAVAA